MTCFCIISYHVKSNQIISYHIISYFIISYHIISYHIISYHIMSCHVMSSHVMSCHVMSCHVMSCHVMSCHVISYHITSYHINQRRKRLPCARTRVPYFSYGTNFSSIFCTSEHHKRNQAHETRFLRDVTTICPFRVFLRCRPCSWRLSCCQIVQKVCA